jgi:hypothetical protein
MIYCGIQIEGKRWKWECRRYVRDTNVIQNISRNLKKKKKKKTSWKTGA